MIGVVAPAGAYRVAVAELPLSTRLVGVAEDAIVVVSGSAGWLDAAMKAAAEGAAAVVVTDPSFVSAADLHDLRSSLDVPVILERPLLRSDLAHAALEARAGAMPQVLAADGGAPGARVACVVRDAAGWLRVFAEGELAVADGGGSLSILEASGGVAATLSIVETARAGRGWIHVQVLGETVSDVEVEGHSARISTSTRTGKLIAPTLFESGERLALRRAVEALRAPEHPSDLHDLIADTAIAEELLGHRRQ